MANKPKDASLRLLACYDVATDEMVARIDIQFDNDKIEPKDQIQARFYCTTNAKNGLSIPYGVDGGYVINANRDDLINALEHLVIMVRERNGRE